jgi:hypothetical protein
MDAVKKRSYTQGELLIIAKNVNNTPLNIAAKSDVPFKLEPENLVGCIEL